jgi:hypothetical protein
MQNEECKVQNSGSEREYRSANLLCILHFALCTPQSPLPAAHERDDFQPVPRGQSMFRVLAARDDFEIHFHGHVARFQAQLAEQIGDRRRSGNRTLLAIYTDIHIAWCEFYCGRTATSRILALSNNWNERYCGAAPATPARPTAHGIA